MIQEVSLNTEAILLLTEPLLSATDQTYSNRAKIRPALLTAAECRKLVRQLEELNREPGDLLNGDALSQLEDSWLDIDPDRLRCLLERREEMERAASVWRDHGIEVVSRFDDHYPWRFRDRCEAKGPLICYGRGDWSLLGPERGSPALAVVGPRDVAGPKVVAAARAGSLAAEAGVTIISGGARGIDQTAMQGALRSHGWAVGVLADRLARLAAQPEARSWIEDGQLTLVSTRDPLSGFTVGHAMQRNKLIYALADVALVVGAHYQRGGTWAGAVEQLRRLHFAPVYLWDDGQLDAAREALYELGARTWPEPSDPATLRALLAGTRGQKLPKSGPAV